MMESPANHSRAPSLVSVPRCYFFIATQSILASLNVTPLIILTKLLLLFTAGKGGFGYCYLIDGRSGFI